ncbi:MAG: hypothetical protein PHI31_09775 [Desulfuromonadaceae bacterium]|nr:hypothetical protein [Desulfuromonadaceae bacterium]
MAFLTTKSILDATQTLIADQTAAYRAKMLTWLNLAMQTVINQPREWEFLKKTAPLPVTSNVITLPADYADFESLTVGDYFFTRADQLTDSEAFESVESAGEIPEGFTINEQAGTITIVPATEETTVTLAYKGTMPAADYADDTTATIFPQEFKPLFVRILKTVSNEVDVEDQYTVSLQLSSADLKTMKALDNKRKALPKPSSHGYIRGRN